MDDVVDVNSASANEAYASAIEERSRAAGVEVTVVRGPSFQNDNPELPEGYADEIEARSRAAGVDVTVVRGPSTAALHAPQLADKQLPAGSPAVMVEGELSLDAIRAAKAKPVEGRPAKADKADKADAAPASE